MRITPSRHYNSNFMELIRAVEISGRSIRLKLCLFPCTGLVPLGVGLYLLLEE